MDPLSLIIVVAAIAFVVWLCVLVPMKMANNRGRSAILWVLVSLFVSPLVAIIVLYAIGEAEKSPAHV